MQITIDVPEWAQERHIRIFAGVEHLAYKPADQNILMIKVERCNNCGWCCEDIVKTLWPLGTKESGECIYLRLEGDGTKVCTLGVARPFGCCFTDPVRDHAVEDAEQKCSIRWKTIEL